MQRGGLMPCCPISCPLRPFQTERAQMTTFLGQCYAGTNREETLHTLWLLQEVAKGPVEDWKATQ